MFCGIGQHQSERPTHRRATRARIQEEENKKMPLYIPEQPPEPPRNVNIDGSWGCTSLQQYNASSGRRRYTSMLSTVQEKITACLPTEVINKIPIKTTAQVLQTRSCLLNVSLVLPSMCYCYCCVGAVAGASSVSSAFRAPFSSDGVDFSVRNYEIRCKGRLAQGYDLHAGQEELRKLGLSQVSRRTKFSEALHMLDRRMRTKTRTTRPCSPVSNQYQQLSRKLVAVVQTTGRAAEIVFFPRRYVGQKVFFQAEGLHEKVWSRQLCFRDGWRPQRTFVANSSA